ncbi:MAG: group II intron maturase-specific domain-containing protein [Thomasclavelia ramosa]
MKHRYSKIQKYLKRKQAVSRPLAIIFRRVNQIVRGWINYFKIGSIKVFLDKFGQGYATRYDVLLSSMEKNQGSL